MQPFSEYAAGKTLTEALLQEYLDRTGTEWTSLEFKAAVAQSDAGLRQAVCALANTNGGELFMGVTDTREILGSQMGTDQVNSTLMQSDAPRSPWHIVDLTRVVVSPFHEIPTRVAEHRAYVLTVRDPGLPALFWSDDRVLELYERRGRSKAKLGGPEALDWNRRQSRARMLLRCYREFDTLSRRLDFQMNYPTDFRLGLPYLVQTMNDGTFYETLTDKDREALLGRASPGGGGSHGFVGDFLELGRRVQRVQERLEREGTPYRDLWRSGEFSNIFYDLQGKRREFRQYLSNAGVSLSDVPPEP